MSYPTIEFSETNIINRKTSRFDITTQEVDNHIEENESSRMAAYNELLLNKLGKFGKSEKEEFIIYHLENISDKKEWLFALERLIDSRIDGDNDLAVLYWQKELKGAKEIAEDLIKKINSSTPDKNVKKIQTPFTVAQIGYLLRASIDGKYVSPDSNMDMFRMVTNNFSSKNRKDISVASLKNHFDNPDPKAIDKMQEVFTHLMQRAKKDKEK